MALKGLFSVNYDVYLALERLYTQPACPHEVATATPSWTAWDAGGAAQMCLPSREVLWASPLPMPDFGHLLKVPELLPLGPFTQFSINISSKLQHSTTSPKHSLYRQHLTQVPGRTSKLFFHGCLPRTSHSTGTQQPHFQGRKLKLEEGEGLPGRVGSELEGSAVPGMVTIQLSGDSAAHPLIITVTWTQKQSVVSSKSELTTGPSSSPVPVRVGNRLPVPY